MYETAYTLQGSGGKLPTQRFIEENGSEDLDNALRQQFINSVNGGLWSATYASVNHEEYWAEGCKLFTMQIPKGHLEVTALTITSIHVPN